jgi:hypothetical protein
MTNEKFKGEVKTLNKFFTKFCKDKHQVSSLHGYKLQYNNINYNFEVDLCNDCNKLLNYSFDRLKECPYDIKPRCRTCATPCYEKDEWKKLAKLMKYSGFKLGLLKIKRLLRLNKKEKDDSIK